MSGCIGGSGVSFRGIGGGSGLGAVRSQQGLEVLGPAGGVGASGGVGAQGIMGCRGFRALGVAMVLVVAGGQQGCSGHWGQRGCRGMGVTGHQGDVGAQEYHGV